MANIGLSLTNGFVGSATSMGNNWLQKNIANGFRSNPDSVRFYAKYEAGGSILNVLARNLMGSAASMLKDTAMTQLKGLANKLLGKNIDEKFEESSLATLIEDAQINDSQKYGVMQINGGSVIAYDAYGNKCVDAMMLAIPVKESVKYTTQVRKRDRADASKDSFQSDTLVWYDPTALVNINSDKNLIISKVQGRDYSRKELVSNGDINFTVTGHILSNAPEVYPAQEVQKFIQIMQYKGIVKINNIILDQFNIDGIIIKDFSLTPKEGYKSQQDYTFNAIGIMPRTEVKVTEDTINIIDNSLQKAAQERSPWQKILDSQLEGLSTDILNVTDQGLALATGMLDGI